MENLPAPTGSEGSSRILDAKDITSGQQPKGIRAEKTKTWLWRSIEYKGTDGKDYLMNRNSAVKYLERNGENVHWWTSSKTIRHKVFELLKRHKHPALAAIPQPVSPVPPSHTGTTAHPATPATPSPATPVATPASPTPAAPVAAAVVAAPPAARPVGTGADGVHARIPVDDDDDDGFGLGLDPSPPIIVHDDAVAVSATDVTDAREKYNQKLKLANLLIEEGDKLAERQSNESIREHMYTQLARFQMKLAGIVRQANTDAPAARSKLGFHYVEMSKQLDHVLNSFKNRGVFSAADFQANAVRDVAYERNGEWNTVIDGILEILTGMQQQGYDAYDPNFNTKLEDYTAAKKLASDLRGPIMFSREDQNKDNISAIESRLAQAKADLAMYQTDTLPQAKRRAEQVKQSEAAIAAADRLNVRVTEQIAVLKTQSDAISDLTILPDGDLFPDVMEEIRGYDQIVRQRVHGEIGSRLHNLAREENGNPEAVAREQLVVLATLGQHIEEAQSKLKQYHDTIADLRSKVNVDSYKNAVLALVNKYPYSIGDGRPHPILGGLKQLGQNEWSPEQRVAFIREVSPLHANVAIELCQAWKVGDDIFGEVYFQEAQRLLALGQQGLEEVAALREKRENSSRQLGRAQEDLKDAKAHFANAKAKGYRVEDTDTQLLKTELAIEKSEAHLYRENSIKPVLQHLEAAIGASAADRANLLSEAYKAKAKAAIEVNKFLEAIEALERSADFAKKSVDMINYYYTAIMRAIEYRPTENANPEEYARVSREISTLIGKGVSKVAGETEGAKKEAFVKGLIEYQIKQNNKEQQLHLKSVAGFTKALELCEEWNLPPAIVQSAHLAEKDLAVSREEWTSAIVAMNRAIRAGHEPQDPNWKITYHTQNIKKAFGDVPHKAIEPISFAIEDTPENLRGKLLDSLVNVFKYDDQSLKSIEEQMDWYSRHDAWRHDAPKYKERLAMLLHAAETLLNLPPDRRLAVNALAVRMQPENPKYLEALLKTQLQARQIDGAKETRARLVAVDPKAGQPPLSAEIDAMFIMNDLDKASKENKPALANQALASLEVAIAAQPDNIAKADIKWMMGQVAIQLGDTANQAKHWKEAIALNPNVTLRQKAFTELLITLHQPAEAFEALQKWRESSPGAVGAPSYQELVGRAHTEELYRLQAAEPKDTDRIRTVTEAAIEAFKIAAQAQNKPFKLNALNRIAYLYLAVLNDRPKAVKYYEQGVALVEKDYKKLEKSRGFGFVALAHVDDLLKESKPLDAVKHCVIAWWTFGAAAAQFGVVEKAKQVLAAIKDPPKQGQPEYNDFTNLSKWIAEFDANVAKAAEKAAAAAAPAAAVAAAAPAPAPAPVAAPAAPAAAAAAAAPAAELTKAEASQAGQLIAQAAELFAKGGASDIQALGAMGEAWEKLQTYTGADRNQARELFWSRLGQVVPTAEHRIRNMMIGRSGPVLAMVLSRRVSPRGQKTDDDLRILKTCMELHPAGVDYGRAYVEAILFNPIVGADDPIQEAEKALRGWSILNNEIVHQPEYSLLQGLISVRWVAKNLKDRFDALINAPGMVSRIQNARDLLIKLSTDVHTPSLRARALMTRALLSEATRQHEDALKNYREAMRLDPESANYVPADSIAIAAAAYAKEVNP